MTLRDLFRWAERYRLSSSNNETFYDWEQCICEDGWCTFLNFNLIIHLYHCQFFCDSSTLYILGYMLIAGRCRHLEESKIIKEVIELNFKKTLDLNAMFNGKSLSTKQLSDQV